VEDREEDRVLPIAARTFRMILHRETGFLQKTAFKGDKIMLKYWVFDTITAQHSLRKIAQLPLHHQLILTPDPADAEVPRHPA
jgi:hypothetical protein